MAKIGIISSFELSKPRLAICSGKLREQIANSLTTHLELRGHSIYLSPYPYKDNKDLKDLDICLVIDKLPTGMVDFKSFQDIPRKVYYAIEPLPWDEGRPHPQQGVHLNWFKNILERFEPHIAVLSMSDQPVEELFKDRYKVDLKGCEVLWSSVYYDPLFHKDSGRTDRLKTAILHFGSHSVRRKRIIKDLKENRGLAIKYIGNMWGGKKLDALNAYAINVSIHSGGMHHFSVSRICDTYACGCLNITETLINLIKFKSEDVVQCSLEEMPKVCKYYLEHDAERQKMIKRGQDLVKKYFSIEVFIDQLLGDFK